MLETGFRQLRSLTALIAALATAGCAIPGTEWIESLDRAFAAADGRLVCAVFEAPDRPLNALLRHAIDSDRVRAELDTGHFRAVRTDASAEPAAFQAATGAHSGLAVAVFDPLRRPVAVHIGHGDASAIAELLRLAREFAPRLAELRDRVDARPATELVHAALCDRLGLTQEAQTVYTRVAERSDAPREAPIAAAQLARLHAERGSVHAARRWLDRAAKIGIEQPKLSPHISFTLAKISMLERRPMLAVRTLNRVLARSPDNPEAVAMRYTLAHALHESGDDSRALATLRALLEHSSDAATRERIESAIAHISSDDHGHTH